MGQFKERYTRVIQKQVFAWLFYRCAQYTDCQSTVLRETAFCTPRYWLHLESTQISTTLATIAKTTRIWIWHVSTESNFFSQSLNLGRRGWDSNSSSWWWEEKGAEALEQRRELPAAYLSSPSFPQYHLSYHCWVWGRCEVQIWGSVGGGPKDRKLLPAAGQDNRAKFWLYLLVCEVGEVERGCWKIRITENPQYMLREVIFSCQGGTVTELAPHKLGV